MLVNYDDNPKNSIVFTSSLILSYLKSNEYSNNFNELYDYCMERNMEYSLFFLSIDWLYILGVIKEINERDEVII